MVELTANECLARIAAGDHELRAWVEVSPQPPLGDGPLRGVPFGAKDIFETRDLATEYGSPIYAGRRGTSDAALITLLRQHGAVLLGKTQTTAFASFDPAPTRNPRAPGRTPGGSSSGSAAAVAAGMAAFALGSQTQGSILRPASYCGVVGLKPTFGALSREGVLPFAPSLDTVGLFTPTAAGMQKLWQAVAGEKAQAPAGPMAAFSLDCEPEMKAAFRRTLAALRAAGFAIATIRPPDGFDRLLRASRFLNTYEGARTHEARWREHGARIGEKLAALVRRGLALSPRGYDTALRTIARMQDGIERLFEKYPVVLTPAAPGLPPLGLASTGDPRMNATWTALHVPAVSVPMAVQGPPLGLQMTAARGRDALLLAAAVQVESAL